MYTSLRNIIFAGFVIVHPLSLWSQTIKEVIFPKLPYKDVSSSIGVSPGGFYIFGTSWEEGWSPVYDLYSFSRPFFILAPNRENKKVVLLPEKASVNSWGTGSKGNSIVFSAAQTSADSFFVLWHNVETRFNDVPPNYSYAHPIIRLAKMDRDSLKPILQHTNGWYPSMIADQDGNLHFVWEQVTLRDTTAYGTFYNYSSTILYQKRDARGVFSTPIQIGKGLHPSLKVQGSRIHILFFAADSANQKDICLSYSKGSGNSFSTAVPLQAIPVNPYNYPISRHTLSWLVPLWAIDSSEVLHLLWRDLYEGNRRHIVHYSPQDGLQIDSLEVAYAQVRFMENGSMRIFGVTLRPAEDSTDFYYYLSTPGHGIQKIHTKTLASDPTLNQVLIDVEGNEHAVLTTKSKTFLLQYAATDSATVVPLTIGYTIGPGAYVTGTNEVWLTGKRDSTYVLLHFSLNDIIVSVAKEFLNIPDHAALHQNYPNPFNPMTAISFELPVSSWVSLKIFTPLGQEVATLVNGEVQAGRHRVQWDAKGMPSGVYFYRLKAGDFRETKKMLYVR